MLLLLFLSTIVVNTAFEAGSIGRIERVSPTHLRCAVKGQADQDGRNRQASWYYFRLDNLPRAEVRIDLTELVGEYNYRPGAHAVTKNTRPVFSYDNQRWTHFTDQQIDWDDNKKELSIRFTPAQRRMWIAHVPPYTTRHLASLLAEARRHRFARVETVGKTVQGRDLPLVTVSEAPEDAKVIWIMARQHAWETGTSWVVDGALRFLTSNAAEAAALRKGAIWKFFPMGDPDGVANGQVRFNTNGFDVNRNWDTADEKRMPEIFFMRRSLLAWVDAGKRIDLFLAMHNQEMGDYIDGPSLPVAQRFYDELAKTQSFQADKGPRNTFRPEQVAPGRMTVNQYLFHSRKIPAFLMELAVQHNTRLGRPRTTEDNVRFGPELLRAMLAAVTK